MVYACDTGSWEDHEFKASLGYVVNFRLTWGTEQLRASLRYISQKTKGWGCNSVAEHMPSIEAPGIDSQQHSKQTSEQAGIAKLGMSGWLRHDQSTTILSC